MNAGRMVGSLLGSFGGRALGGMVGGPAGRMVGSVLGAMVAGRGSRGIGGAMKGLGGMLGGNDDDERQQAAAEMDDETALVLVRAMTNSAKADGEVDDDEIAAIFSRAGELDDDEQEFIRNELKSPLDLDEFIASVPSGMEADVYTASLLPIEVDTVAETQYLQDLADGLGLAEDDVTKIHEALGV